MTESMMQKKNTNQGNKNNKFWGKVFSIALSMNTQLNLKIKIEKI